MSEPYKPKPDLRIGDKDPLSMLTLQRRLGNYFAYRNSPQYCKRWGRRWLSAEGLARDTGIPACTLRRYLVAQTVTIPVDRFDAICRAMDISVSDLIGAREMKPRSEQLSHFQEAPFKRKS